MTALEENGGSDGNSSVAELEVRVETLEGTAVDHETRISDTEVDVSGMCGVYILFISIVGNYQCTWWIDLSNDYISRSRGIHRRLRVQIDSSRGKHTG